MKDKVHILMFLNDTNLTNAFEKLCDTSSLPVSRKRNINGFNGFFAGEPASKHRFISANNEQLTQELEAMLKNDISQKEHVLIEKRVSLSPEQKRMMGINIRKQRGCNSLYIINVTNKDNLKDWLEKNQIEITSNLNSLSN